jgi:hypothetical protein
MPGFPLSPCSTPSSDGQLPASLPPLSLCESVDVQIPHFIACGSEPTAIDRSWEVLSPLAQFILNARKIRAESIVQKFCKLGEFKRLVQTAH